jgi:hypothetical protein
MEETEKVPFTWAKMKEFCDKLTEEQLSQQVKCIREDDTITILDAGELGDDHYYFLEEEESISKDSWDKSYFFDGKYETLADAVANEENVMTRNKYLFI